MRTMTKVQAVIRITQVQIFLKWANIMQYLLNPDGNFVNMDQQWLTLLSLQINLLPKNHADSQSHYTNARHAFVHIHNPHTIMQTMLETIPQKIIHEELSEQGQTNSSSQHWSPEGREAGKVSCQQFTLWGWDESVFNQTNIQTVLRIILGRMWSVQAFLSATMPSWATTGNWIMIKTTMSAFINMQHSTCRWPLQLVLLSQPTQTGTQQKPSVSRKVKSGRQCKSYLRMVAETGIWDGRFLEVKLDAVCLELGLKCKAAWPRHYNTLSSGTMGEDLASNKH